MAGILFFFCMRQIFLHICIIGLFAACKKSDTSVEKDIFDAQPMATPVTPGKVDEASGIADSKKNPGYLWVQQDSGNPEELLLLSYTGELKKKIKLKGVSNRDWEDIALAKGPQAGVNYIYLADIGNNNLSAQKFFIYRFPEPRDSEDEVEAFEKITFIYPDGTHDAEALLVDNNTKDIYIITKRDSLSGIYKIDYPQALNVTNKATLIGHLPFNNVVSAAFSPDGNEVLIKTYSSIYYWRLNNGSSIREALYTTPVHVSYLPEPQGEAITFKNDNKGFFTLSERPQFIREVKLYFYLRK